MFWNNYFDTIESICEKNKNTCALLDSIPLYILYNYLLDVWLTPSITIFMIKV